MYFQKLTPTEVLTSGANIIIATILGFATLVAFLLMLFTITDGLRNHKRLNEFDSIGVARAHIIQDNARYPCIILQLDNGKVIYDRNTPKCLETARAVTNWQHNAITKSSDGVGTVLVWSILGLIFIIAMYPMARIPGILISALFPPATPLLPFMTFICLLPGIFFVWFAVGSSFGKPPIAWKNPNGDVVRTEMVYVTKDALYKKPDNMYGWTDPNAGMQLEYHNFKF